MALDLKGHTLTVPAGVSWLFQVQAGGSLIIEDSDTGGTITAEETAEEGVTTSVAPVSMTGDEFWLKSGALTSVDSTVEIAHNAAGASFLMTGGTFYPTAILRPNFSFTTYQENKTLDDYLGEGAALDDPSLPTLFGFYRNRPHPWLSNSFV